MNAALIAIVAVVVIVLLFLYASIKVLREYERGVIFRLGRVLREPKGPGLILVFRPIDRMVRLSFGLDTTADFSAVNAPAMPTLPSHVTRSVGCDRTEPQARVISRGPSRYFGKRANTATKRDATAWDMRTTVRSVFMKMWRKRELTTIVPAPPAACSRA